MISLNSSAIDGVDYSETYRQLTVYFRNGRAYIHPGVPVSIFEGLINAASPGGYYNAYIRGRYR